MAQFTPTKCYNLAKHTVKFDNKGIHIIDNSGKEQDTRDFADGFEIMVHEGSFCFGSISFDDSFTNTIDLNNQDSKVSFDSTTKRIVGEDQESDPGITKHLYDIDRCPIKMLADRNNILTITCPCDTENAQCSNKCYTYQPPK